MNAAGLYRRGEMSSTPKNQSVHHRASATDTPPSNGESHAWCAAQLPETPVRDSRAPRSFRIAQQSNDIASIDIHGGLATSS